MYVTNNAKQAGVYACLGGSKGDRGHVSLLEVNCDLAVNHKFKTAFVPGSQVPQYVRVLKSIPAESFNPEDHPEHKDIKRRALEESLFPLVTFGGLFLLVAGGKYVVNEAIDFAKEMIDAHPAK